MCHSERREESFAVIKTKISPVGRNDKIAFLRVLQEAQYDIHIRHMLISVIGLISLEDIEGRFEKTGKITKLKSALSNLAESRNKAAYTHLKGSINNYDAPSVIRGEFQKIMPILLELDSELRAM